jgi:hypothetical protein
LRENFPEATEYYIRFSSPDDYLESNIITIDFGDGSVGGIDLETIYIANVIQESFSNETITTQINFANNSLNGGQLVTRLFYNGTPLGENTVNCIGQSGPTNSSFTHSQIQGNRTYQMLFENTDIDDPIYAFVDSTGEAIMGTNDEPVSSIVLEFTSSETTATVVNQTPNIGPDTI